MRPALGRQTCLPWREPVARHSAQSGPLKRGGLLVRLNPDPPMVGASR
jgi:hypothetical protein